MNLVIVESPTKARTLSKFLGDDYRIESTTGHVRDLPGGRFGVKISKENGSIAIVPEYQVIRKKEEKIHALQAIASSSDTVVLATDPDREGEAIAWHVASLLGEQATSHKQQATKKFQRVTFHQITKDAILDAIKHPRSLDMNLVDAQQARRILDRMVGYQLSPLLWRKIRRGLSAGRVQSVVVRLIVDREREIGKFIPVEYWDIYAEVSQTNAKETCFVKLVAIDGKKAELTNKEQADPVLSDLEKALYRVSDVERREVRRGPFPPFTTSTLQQAGSRLFHWSGKKTMSVAQQLYEHGFITYHRTDSFHLATEAIDEIRKLISGKFGAAFLSETPRFYKAKATALIQEAHEAIRATDFQAINDLQKIDSEIGIMGKESSRLFQLIWRRSVACQMTDQLYDQTIITVDATAERKMYQLQVRGQIEKFAGWHVLYQTTGKIRPLHTVRAVSGEAGIVETVGDTEAQKLPDVSIGEELRKLHVIPEQHFTEPPGRYTEAMLIRALELHGIGRPSTYAPIVSTIQLRGYVERKEGRFHPLPVGLVVTDFLSEHFPQIVDYDFTRGMEEDLDRIASGQRPWKEVLGVFWSPFEEKVGRVGKEAARKQVPVEDTGNECPLCHKGNQVIRSGKFGKFLSCSTFPACRWTDKFIEKIGMICPNCTSGEVIIKKTKTGKHFFGCSRYPECTFASWKKPKPEIAVEGPND